MKDADFKFLEAVTSMELDLEGELAVRCTGSCEYLFPAKTRHLIWGRFSTHAFPICGMDGESIGVDGELSGRWPRYVPLEYGISVS